MNIQKRIKDLEKRVDVLEGKPIIERQKKLSLTTYGWSYKKSKKEREDAIDRILKEHGGRTVHDALGAMKKKYKNKSAIEACKESQEYIVEKYPAEYEYNGDAGGELEVATAAKENSKRPVNLRKHGWFYTKSKKSREVAIDKAIKEYGVNPVYMKAFINSQKKSPSGNAYEEATNYMTKNYDIKSRFGMKRKK